jgi:hypothetical protein
MVPVPVCAWISWSSLQWVACSLTHGWSTCAWSFLFELSLCLLGQFIPAVLSPAPSTTVGSLNSTITAASWPLVPHLEAIWEKRSNASLKEKLINPTGRR